MSQRGGTGKLRSHWEEHVPVVKSKSMETPVFEIIPENGEGKPRKVHRNLLLKCDFLPLEIPKKKNHRG